MTVVCSEGQSGCLMLLYLFCVVAVLAVGFVTLFCHNGAVKKRLHLCQVHMSQELCYVVKTMFVILSLCEYLQEVLLRSSIVQRATWLGHI